MSSCVREAFPKLIPDFILSQAPISTSVLTNTIYPGRTLENRDSIDVNQVDNLDAQINRIRRENEILNKKSSEQVLKIHTVTQQNKVLLDQHWRVIQEVDSLRLKYTNLAQSANKLLRANDQLNKEVTRMHNELERSEFVKYRFNQSHTQLSSLISDRDRLKVLISDHEQTIDRLMLELTKIRKQSSVADELRKQIYHLTFKNKTLEGCINEGVEQLDKLIEEIKVLNIERQNFDLMFIAKCKENEELRYENATIPQLHNIIGILEVELRTIKKHKGETCPIISENGRLTSLFANRRGHS